MITQDQTTVFCEKCQSDSIPQLYFTFLGGGGFSGTTSLFWSLTQDPLWPH